MIETKEKTDEQRRIGQIWRYSKDHGANAWGRGIIAAAGGFGKSYTACKFIITPFLENAFSKGKFNTTVILLVPTEKLLIDWNDKVRKLIPHKFHESIKVLSSKSIGRDTKIYHCDLLAVDEIHLMYGEQEVGCIDGSLIKFTYNVALSATPIDKNGVWKGMKKLWPIIYRLTKKEAIEKGFITRFREYNLGIRLPHEDMKKYNEYSNNLNALYEKYGDYNVLFECAQGKKDFFGIKRTPWDIANDIAGTHDWSPDCSEEIHELWNPNQILEDARVLLTNVRLRKEMLYEHPLKVMWAMKVIKKFPKVRTISFSQSIMFAENLHTACTDEAIPASLYHSGMESRPVMEGGQYIRYKTGAKKGSVKLFGKDSLKKMAIHELTTGQTYVLSTTSSLDVGLDIPSMRIGIITSRTTNKNKQDQRGYRVTRIDLFNPENDAILVNIYFKDTQDEKWLNSAQYKTDSTIYDIKDVDEIELDVEDDGFTL